MFSADIAKSVKAWRDCKSVIESPISISLPFSSDSLVDVVRVTAEVVLFGEPCRVTAVSAKDPRLTGSSNTRKSVPLLMSRSKAMRFGGVESGINGLVGSSAIGDW